MNRNYTKDQLAVKARKERLISEGLCFICGQEPHKEGIKMCVTCSDKSKLRSKMNRIENKKKVQDSQKRSMAKKPELYKSLKHKTYLRHKDEWSKWGREYRAREMNAVGSFTEREWKDLLDKYEHKCLCCGSKIKLERDHVIPLVKGGTNTIDNIQPLCRVCNASKGKKILDFRPFGRAILDWT